jgi:endonuclease/exonuclease/phosphatase family metal-dependent hydrolase
MRLITWNVSWNVAKGIPERPRRHVEAVRDCKPDVVALQEIAEADLPGYAEALRNIGLTHVLSLVPSRGMGIVLASSWSLDLLPETTTVIPPDEVEFFRKGGAESAVRLLSALVRRDGTPLEVHVAHVPHGSGAGWRKIDALRGIYQRLAQPSTFPRILCGDFNEPRQEGPEGPVTWAGRNRYSKVNPERWDAAVKNVLLNLEYHNLGDVFRSLHGERLQVEWSYGSASRRRRYDHVFASSSLRSTEAKYLHEVDEAGLSDHTPACVTFAG